MASFQNSGEFIFLDPNQEERYQQVLDAVRTIKKHNPELGEAFILNALIATGGENLANQIEDWIEDICDIDSRERPAFCHGHGPRPDKIVRLKSMDEIAGLPAFPET